MLLDYLGHAAFLVESQSGHRILFDPYESGGFDGRVGYAPIVESVDFVLITHDHLDHSHTGSLPPGFEVIRTEGWAGESEVHSVTSFHDEHGGTRFGGTVDMKVLEVDGVRICHAGDLGEQLTARHLEELGSIDLFIVPVGGFYTLNAAGARKVVDVLQPRVVVPCHYKTARCGFDLEGPEPFLAQFERVLEPGGSSWRVTGQTLPEDPMVVWLHPRL